jgi:hypothetical protein
VNGAPHDGKNSCRIVPEEDPDTALCGKDVRDLRDLAAAEAMVGAESPGSYGRCQGGAGPPPRRQLLPPESEA